MRDKLYCRTHPGHPWLTPTANELLRTMLRPSDTGLEFGSGRSTLWFAARVRQLTSVEHDKTWYDDVSARLRQSALEVDYLLAPRDVPAEHGGESQYTRVISRRPDRSLDFVLVDGIYRDFCAYHSLSKLKSGGLLIVDNVNWYLPSRSHSPNSRRPQDGPDGPVWSEVAATTREWRSIWTSSGVWDTAIYVKP